MRRLLHVIGSPWADGSRSGKVADAFLSALRANDSSVSVETIDVWREPLPEFESDEAEAKMAVITGNALGGTTAAAWERITRVIRRFTKADDYLFTVPMWNGTVPYRLKLYIDILTQPGLLFGFDPTSGYTGLLRNKRATVIYTSGVYGVGVAPNFGVDFHSTYFDWWLRFIGVTDVESIRFQPNLLTADPERSLGEAIALARQRATRLAMS